ncbi:MAG: sensor histidine kinase [Candidatus Kariarchaeaceae archaeon]
MKSFDYNFDKSVTPYVILFFIITFTLESLFHYLMDLASLHQTSNILIHAAIDVCLIGGIGYIFFYYYNKDKRKMQEYINRSKRSEALGLVASGMAHEINNNLMKITGYADIALSNANLEEKTKQSIISLKKIASQTGQTINQLLTYTGNTSISSVWIDLNRLLINALDSMRSIIPNTVSVNFDLNHNIPKIHIDQALIKQVVTNLVENAKDAIEDDHGNITISTGISYVEKSDISDSNFEYNLYPGEFVYFEISDTGIGIDPEDYERIFEPFFTTKFIGKGLGLAVVLGILRAHQAVIQVTSEKGEGSSFKILLPVAEPDKGIN